MTEKEMLTELSEAITIYLNGGYSKEVLIRMMEVVVEKLKERNKLTKI